MDRFHPVPDVPARAASWAEWLYFNGRSNDARFYLTFLSGPRSSPGRRVVGVRLQLERGGRMDKGHAAEIAAWHAAVKSGGPAPIPLDEVLEVSRWAIRAAEQARSGAD